MGKMTSVVPRGTFKLYRTSRVGKEKPLTVQIQVSVNSVAVRRATGITALEADWNPNENKGRGGVRASFGRDYRAVNAKLVKLAESFEHDFEEYAAKHAKMLTPAVVRDIMDGKPCMREDNGVDFADYVCNLLKEEYGRNKIGVSVYRNGMSVMNMFGEFLSWKGLGTYKKDGIYVSEISASIVSQYIAWRRDDKKNNLHTINHALTPIIKACKQGVADGFITQQTCMAISNMRLMPVPSLQSDSEDEVHHLSETQLKELIEFYKVDMEPRRREYVEMFLFSMYACGMRVVDILTLQWSDIDMEAGTINKIQVKTRNRNIIPLSGKAKKILESWKERYPANRFVFGLLPNDFDLDNTEALYKVRNSKTRGINQSLSVIGKKLHLKFELTFHVARHSFAVHSLNQGMGLTTVSQLMGHSSTEITEKVYAHYLSDTLAKQLSQIKLPDFD